ncbi:hypothetical protein VP01_327g3 [Puccinia sorghi]|uniref:Uncharacterized protein n=1 Tax=Puccinia sorghi TaxID=27349 RepID=A0A0L6UXT5_9BASI|nr:hypothetical protein VP01_327g3 [Puccinia sorghi]
MEPMNEEEWEYEEEADEDGSLLDEAEEQFPIGYTIDFGAESEDFWEHSGEGGAGHDVPRGGLGSQALPVSDSLRADWDGIPADGAEYLFTSRSLSLSLSQQELWFSCRREARARPRVVAKHNPFKSSSSSRPSSVRLSPITIPSTPYDSWRKRFIERFTNMRQSFQALDPLHWQLDDLFRRPPPDNDLSNWKIFIAGKKNSPLEFPPRQPIPLFLKALEQTTVIAVLSHYQVWIQERIGALARMVELGEGREEERGGVGGAEAGEVQEIVLLSPSDGAWLLGLLAVLDSVLTSEDVFKLRQLARTCKHVVRISNAAMQLQHHYSDDALQEAAPAWMVIAAVADVWGQKDLWNE